MNTDQMIKDLLDLADEVENLERASWFFLVNTFYGTMYAEARG